MVDSAAAGEGVMGELQAEQEQVRLQEGGAERGGGEEEGHMSATAVASGSESHNGAGDSGDDDDEEEGDEDALEMVRRLAQMCVPSRGGAVGASGNDVSTALSMPASDLGGETLAKDRNRVLIAHMLSLANPVISEPSLPFFTQPSNLKLLVSFITQVPESDQPPPPVGAGPGVARPGLRPQRGEVLDAETEAALARSFNAVVLLASEEPTEALVTLLRSRSSVLTEALFDVFNPHARGSFYHACKVIDYLLRLCTDQVLMVLGHSKSSVKKFVGSMIRCLEHPPVAEMMVKLICLPPLNQHGQYKATPSAKWRLFESLAEWRLLVVLAGEVFEKSSTPAHACACADVLIDLVERLAADENGELVLQPLGHCAELVNGLMHCALDPTAVMSQRCDCARVLVSICARSAEPQLPTLPSMGNAPFGPGSIVMMPNQLWSVRSDFYKRLGSHMQSLCDCLLGEGPLPPPPTPQPVAHPGYVVAVPFSYLRLLLITLLVDILAVDPKRLGKLQHPVWRTLCNWFFTYPFANLYHALFYKLVFQALRCGDETIQQTVLSKCRLVSSMVDAYVKGESNAGNRGYIVRLCNALRLQAVMQPPSSWLCTFLKSHDSWRKFTPLLREVTEKQQVVGLGIQVPSMQKRFGMSVDVSGGANPLGTGFLDLPEPPSAAVVCIDHGSNFAKTLGFGDDDVEYVVADSVAQSSQKRKKKKKKKGKGGAKAETSEDRDDDEEEEDEGREGNVSMQS